MSPHSSAYAGEVRRASADVKFLPEYLRNGIDNESFLHDKTFPKLHKTDDNKPIMPSSSVRNEAFEAEDESSPLDDVSLEPAPESSGIPEIDEVEFEQFESISEPHYVSLSHDRVPVTPFNMMEDKVKESLVEDDEVGDRVSAKDVDYEQDDDNTTTV